MITKRGSLTFYFGSLLVEPTGLTGFGVGRGKELKCGGKLRPHSAPGCDHRQQLRDLTSST